MKLFIEKKQMKTKSWSKFKIEMMKDEDPNEQEKESIEKRRRGEWSQ